MMLRRCGVIARALLSSRTGHYSASSVRARMLLRPWARRYTTSADDAEEETEVEVGEGEGDEDELEDAAAGDLPRSTTGHFKKFHTKEHIYFLAAPYLAKPNPEFMRLYYVLYFLLAFLLRSRRQRRYATYLTARRVEGMAAAEDLPGHVGRVGQELLRLNQLKAEALREADRRGLLDMGPDLARLRALAGQQAGGPREAAAAYRSLYHTAVLTLHNYDMARVLDQWRPGPAGRLVPRPTRPPPTAPPVVFDAAPGSAASALKFLYRRDHVVLYEAEPDAGAEDDAEPLTRTGVDAHTPRYRMLGTLPTVMPRRQLEAYGRLYAEDRARGALPPALAGDPLRALRLLCRQWVHWALTRQREVKQSQRRLFAGTAELATRMLRYHQGAAARMMVGSATGAASPQVLAQSVRQYYDRLGDFYATTLVKYMGPSDQVLRLLRAGAGRRPQTPAELFDAVWRDVFGKKEGILWWRLNHMRRNYLIKMRGTYAKLAPPQTVSAKRNTARFLRHYYLTKAVLSMSTVGRPPRPHPSRPLAQLRYRLLALLYELLLPVARVAYHTDRTARTVEWRGAMAGAARSYRPAPAPPAPAPPRAPKGEIATDLPLVRRYPLPGGPAGAYLNTLRRYRRNHLLRTSVLALNFTPRGPQADHAPPPAKPN